MAPPCDRSVVSLIWFTSKNHKLAGGKAISSSFMSAKHVRVLARSIHVPRASRQLQAADAENIAPTKEERDIIDKLPYFQYEPKPSTQGLTKAKRAYLERKLPIVHELFKDENSSRYLTYNLPAKLPNPYLDAHARPITDPVTGNVKYGGTPRLSVTKMLTKRWCELREAYDIYSRVPIFQHRQVTQGRREHQRLEDEIHAPLSDIDEFKSDFEIDIPDDAFHSLVEDWFLTIVRLLTLFQKGHAREILCHGYIDSRTSTFIHGEVKGEQHVLVSGVVDHLILRDQNSPNDKKQVPLENNILARNGYDLTQVIKSLSALVQDASKDLELVVSDVKTRATKTVPRQHSVVKASKLQVMYYRYFLEELSKDTELTYQKLLTNAERRGFDVDKPVSPAKIINLLEIDGIIRTDMERLQKGESIEFPSYDSDMEADGQIYEYNWEELDGQITDLGTRQKYGELFTKWGTPVTLRYFAARLAQLYSCLNPLLSQNLLVEYYSGDVNFHNISFNYDKKELESESFDSAQFWFGRRDIEPIKPNLGNLLTYCKYCDYESVCLWKKEGKETCRKLGQELTSLDSSQEN